MALRILIVALSLYAALAVKTEKRTDETCKEDELDKDTSDQVLGVDEDKGLVGIDGKANDEITRTMDSHEVCCYLGSEGGEFQFTHQIMNNYSFFGGASCATRAGFSFAGKIGDVTIAEPLRGWPQLCADCFVRHEVRPELGGGLRSLSQCNTVDELNTVLGKVANVSGDVGMGVLHAAQFPMTHASACQVIKGTRDGRPLHIVFSSFLGTELGAAFPVMFKLRQLGVNVTVVARTEDSNFAATVPGFKTGLVTKLGKHGIVVVRTKFLLASDQEIASQIGMPVDLFVEDFSVQKGRDTMKEALLTPTHVLAHNCGVPESWWGGNTVGMWEFSALRRAQRKPFDLRAYPTFVASFSGSWDPPRSKKQIVQTMVQPPPLFPNGESPKWKNLEGLKVAFVRSEVSAADEPGEKQQTELDRVHIQMAKSETAFLVYFVLGTQGVELTQLGARRIVEELGSVKDAVVYFVLPAASGGPTWKTTLGSKNMEIVDEWKAWYGNPIPENFVLTTFAPQVHLMTQFSGETGRMIMVNSCGAGSLNEATDSLTPVIGLPYMTDQPGNSYLIQESGAGLDRSQIVDAMKDSGDFKVPYGWVGKHLPWMGNADLPPKEGTGTTIAHAIDYMRDHWESFKRGVAGLKVQRDENTFSQDEAAQEYVNILLREGKWQNGNLFGEP